MSTPPPAASRPSFTPRILALVLFGSGLCSLVYQTVWLREFRLVFGGAAPAAAAVLAVFMAGLGFGGAWFGARAERAPRPLRFYAWLEGGIALAAALTPALLSLARALYLASGGVSALGLAGATFVQIGITVLVLGGPCFLIGGTLPVAMKFAQRNEDSRRADTALFYGINVAGALTGAALGTFALLPALGNFATLFTAVAVNATIAAIAGTLSRVTERPRAQPAFRSHPAAPLSGTVSAATAPQAPVWFVLAAAFLAGFTFFVAELVWYRVSTPLLGGTVHGFGTVLCVVLGGMAAGGVVYAALLRRCEPSLVGFSVVSALQALAIAAPYALGDRLSYFALVLDESLRGFGFGPQVFAWVVIVAALAFLPALFSGIQFPLLISLLGRGNTGIGRELGRAYFWNTVGSVSGSLLGGFVLIPFLSATRSWLIIVLLLAGVAVTSLGLARRHRAFGPRAWFSFALTAASLALLVASSGPTAAWLQAPIGYGRLHVYPKNRLELEAWERDQRRQELISFDGRDANVAAVDSQDQRAFLTNGKSDGSSVSDAPTQVFLGLVGAILHPREIERCCVIGLGTGSSAGWLADVPGVRAVDVIEIESRAAEIARQFAAANRRALDNPKVRLVVGDGREVLQTRGERYDLIASEPSNPYRTGVANLYTREFYQSVTQRLTPDGIFCQWLQGYETDTATVRLIMATLASEFEKVELWNTQNHDLLFVCSPSSTPWNADLVRTRLRQPLFLEACTRLWHTNSAEGFFTHATTDARFARALADSAGTLNTDDRNRLEFAAARHIGRAIDDPLRDLFADAAGRGLAAPAIAGQLDAERFALERVDLFAKQPELAEIVLRSAGPLADALRQKYELTSRFDAGQSALYARVFADSSPETLEERFHFAVATAETGHARAAAAADDLARTLPETRPFLTALRAQAAGNLDGETDALTEALHVLRSYPWVDPRLTRSLAGRLNDLATGAAAQSPALARRLFAALQEPFEDGMFCDTRRTLLTLLARHLGPEERRVAVAAWGRHYPFSGDALALRLISCGENGDPHLPVARADVKHFLALGGRLPASQRPAVDQILGQATSD